MDGRHGQSALRRDAQPVESRAIARWLERGSGAAIAGGLVPLATATDGGGSVRIPDRCGRAGRLQAHARHDRP